MATAIRQSLAAGLLARTGHLDEAAQDTATEVIARVGAEGLETVRLVFPDPHGILRGKTVVARALPSAFRDGVGMPSTIILKDTSQRTVFPVWEADAGFGAGELTGASDVLLAPDPATFRTLPWSPTSGWMMCDVVTKDGRAIPFSSRAVLRSAIDRLAGAGLRMVTGLEVEFHVLRIEDARAAHVDTGMPPAPYATSALTRAYSLLSDAHYDALEEVMDALRRACEGLGLPLRTMEPEFGPSQVEFTFDPAGPMEHADGMVLFRAMAKQVCRRMGLHATFMCRPKIANGAASGWHLHQSVVDAETGENRFVPKEDGVLSPTASGWIAGLLEHAAECCLVTTPSVNGYKRYQAFQLAPDRVQWAVDNKGAMIRGLMRPGDPASRIENRVPEPAANPHFVIASQILAGLDGIERGLVAPPPAENPYGTNAPKLPTSLLDAIVAFEGGRLFSGTLGPSFTAYLSRLKRAEWDRYVAALSEWEQQEYFDLY
ncbi:glutamine synthetase family protein [Acuticoccus sediminis]|uniref:glutamine synthetase family protein n=1 Tax=Acuticoccus sediminis TaxID=2184697 RepID=UPI00192E428C|nr:glutamine synthetase family protein [Acuticoccus sediminis]